MIVAPAQGQGQRIGFAPAGSPAAQTSELLLDRTPRGATAAVMESGAGSDSALATLRVRSGLPAGATFPVRQSQATMGSDPASDIVLDGAGVAPRHAQLRLRGGVWTLVDFGSAAGSAVDGSAVRGEALLAPGSSVRVGSVEFAFAPSDRWQDSPPERRAGDRAPLLLLPPEPRSLWPTVAFVLAVCGMFVATYFLLRNA